MNTKHLSKPPIIRDKAWTKINMMEKLYYTIGEVAEMFDVNQSLIRFWEKEFDIINPHKNKKGNRLFTQEDINSFHLIYHLVKEKGMTLKGAQQQIKNNKKHIDTHFEIIKRLKDIRSELIAIKEELS